ncbi:MAG: cytochrome-c peroxidase [Acidobacteriota bacterium]|nr:MAG: cytochrome-c peroxidase [Acidobacteriota bacterium]
MSQFHVIGRIGRMAILLAFGCAVFALGVAEFSAQEKPYAAPIPLGLPEDTWEFYQPRRNPLTPAKIELGRKLFFDQRLSIDGTVSCATCHKPELGFTDGKPVAEGVMGRTGARNSMTLLNVTFVNALFWDGRAETLEEQAIQPLTNPLEMGNGTHAEVVERLRAIPDYVDDFRRAFGGEVTIERVGMALASFERTLVSGDSPFDRFMAGDETALSPEARQGLAVFRGRGRCSRCHLISEQMPFFTNFAYQNTGVAANHPNFESLARRAAAAAVSDNAKELIDRLGREPGGQELGRILISYQLFDLGAYRTPSLRNVGITAPYFHDGSAKTLADVVRFYNNGGGMNINIEAELHPLGLSEGEQRDLVGFLESLTGMESRMESRLQSGSSAR